MKTPVTLVALLLSASCASSGANMPADDRIPTPYTAEAIRAACPVGTRLVYRVVAGGATSLMTMSFVEADAAGATVETAMTTEGGEPLGLTTTETSSWEEFRDHANFEESATARTEASITVPAGMFSTWLYTVRADDGSITRYHFALDSAGPPVWMDKVENGETEFVMELVERSGS